MLLALLLLFAVSISEKSFSKAVVWPHCMLSQPPPCRSYFWHVVLLLTHTHFLSWIKGRVGGWLSPLRVCIERSIAGLMLLLYSVVLSLQATCFLLSLLLAFMSAPSNLVKARDFFGLSFSYG